MEIRSAVFRSSSTSYTQCPQTTQPELALLGRSNVGKSSFINMLLGNNRLAKVSREPGKTQLINHFLVNNAFHFVDLPGYGWAQVSSSQRQKWEKMVKAYLLYRTQLCFALVLLDARHKPQQLDMNWIHWLGSCQIPFWILLTKADKKSRQQVQKNLALLNQELSKEWEVIPPIFVTSSREKTGRKEILHRIEQALNEPDA